MPKYLITDSATGEKLYAFGDSAPTEEEAQELFQDFYRSRVSPVQPGVRYDVARGAVQAPAPQGLRSVLEFLETKPKFVQNIVSDAEQAYRDAPPGSLGDAIKQAGVLADSLRAAWSGQNPAEDARQAIEAASKIVQAVEEPAAATNLFMATALSELTTPGAMAPGVMGPVMRGITKLAKLGRIAPEALQTAAATSVGINTLTALPAAEAAGEAWGAASVDPTIQNVATAAGLTVLTGLGAAGVAVDLPSVVKKIPPRDRVVTDKEWAKVRDRVKTAQVADEVASPPVPEAPAPTPEPVRTILESGETIRVPEAISETELRTTREAKATVKFNERVKRITETFKEDGVKLLRSQAAELARIEDPREYSLTRQAILDATRPTDVGTTAASVAKTETQLKSFEELTPEMVGARVEEPTPPKATGVIPGEVPVLETPAGAVEGLGEPPLPVSPRMLELERPMYDSGLRDPQGNRIWVDEAGRPIDRPAYEDPRERIRRPEERAAYEAQIREQIAFEDRAKAVDLVSKTAPGDAVLVTTPESPTPIPAKFVQSQAGGKVVVDTPQGRVTVEATALSAAPEVPVTPTTAVVPVVTKVKDPAVGGWNVQIGNNNYRIYRDSELRSWFLDAPVYDPKLQSVGGFGADLLATTNKEDAIANLVANESRWIQKIEAAKQREPKTPQAKAAPRKPSGKKIFTDRERGAINLALLNQLGQTSVGTGTGFYAGYNLGEDLPVSERIANGLQGALLGFLTGNPRIRNAMLQGVYKAKVPIKSILPNKGFANGGMDNFPIFLKSALGELYDEIKLQGSRAEGLKAPAMKALDYLIDQRAKAMRLVTDNPDKLFLPSDFETVNRALVGGAEFDAVRDPVLRAAAKEFRSRVDDLSRYLISSGYAEAGSDLATTIDQSIGRYLYRTYRMFTDPDFVPDQKKMQAAAEEYASQLLIDGDPRPRIELLAEGWKQVEYQFQKPEGKIFSSNNAVSFALGRGIARMDGTLLAPRKQLTDAWRDMMGEIKDPLEAAGLTVNRLADAVAAIKTQEAMVEVGLKLGLFSRTRSEAHPIRYSDASSSKIYGDLAAMYTTPEVADGLRAMQAYKSAAWPYRALVTATGAVKLGKTAFSPITYAVNLVGASIQTLAQGGALRVVLNPGSIKDAYRVVFDTPFPKLTENLKSDIEFLLSNGVLRQSVVVNDLAEMARKSYIPELGANAVTWVPKGAVTTAAKKLGRGVVTTYGNFEELPKMVGFYAEVNRWSKAIFNKEVDALTPAEKATVYREAVNVVKEVYPNHLKVPEVFRTLSNLGALNPFVAFQYEVFRTTYATLRRGRQEFEMSIRLKNPRIAAIAASRISTTVGIIAGAVAISEGLKASKGISSEQEKELKKNMPEWDRNGMLLLLDVTPDEVAYANQSYLIPQAIISRAIQSATEGDTPAEALLSFFKTTAGEMVGEDGGLVIGPALDALAGETNLGRRIYPQDGGKYIDISGIEGENTMEAAAGAQNFIARSMYLLNKAAPGFVTESQRWYKAAKEEVGPDGQVYKMSDLTQRLFGVRVHRLNLPLQYRRRANTIAARFNTALSEFRKVRDRLDTTPAKLDEAYELSEQSRKIVFRDLVGYLRGGVIAQQPTDQMVKNLREAGVSSELIFNAITGVYTPGPKEATVTARERYDLAMRGKPEGERLATWANIQRTDPALARAWREFAREESMQRTEVDRVLLNFEERDGTRAQKAAIYILSKPTQAERDATYQGLVNRGVLRGPTLARLTANDEASAKLWAEADQLVKTGKALNALALPPSGGPLASPPPRYVEGRIYQDRTTKKKVRYQNGQFVPVEP